MKLKIFVCMLILLFSSVSARAEYIDDSQIPIDASLNGVYLNNANSPYMQGDITFVPLRVTMQAFGAEVSWDAENNCAYISHGDFAVTLTENGGSINNSGVVTEIYTGFTMKDAVAYIPSRLVVDIFGGTVSWDDKYYVIRFEKAGITVPETVRNIAYGDNEILWLSRIIEAESSGEPLNGKIGVGNVILNRVKSGEFPDTIFGVIFDSKYGIQFQPVKSGTIYNNPSKDSIVAAKKALRNENVVGESLYFFNPRTAKSNWISRNRKYYTTIANHAFYL